MRTPKLLLVLFVASLLAACSLTPVQTGGPVILVQEEQPEFQPVVSTDGTLQADCREGDSTQGQAGIWFVLRGLIGGQWTDLYKNFQGAGSCNEESIYWKLYAWFLAGTQVFREYVAKAGLDPNEVNDLMNQLKELVITP